MNDIPQPKGFATSIHFGIDERVYRADPALSYSGMKAILESPLEYWLDSPLNPKHGEFIESDPMKAAGFGKAFHTLLLEPKQFNKRYYITPIEPRSTGKDYVKLSQYNDMKEAIRVLKEMETYSLYFEGGYPEVAVFWRCPLTGIMLKAKHDYFNAFYSSDFKSTDTLKDKKLRWKIDDYGYCIQDAHYLDSRVQIRAALQADEALIYGDVDPSFLKAFMGSQGDSFIFVFQKKKSPFGATLKQLDQAYNDDGWRDIRQAKETYIKYLRKYGTKMWPVSDGTVRELSRYGKDNSY